jgi:putative transcriptional regulator
MMLKSTLKIRMAERDLTFKALAQRSRITPRTLSNLAHNKLQKLDVSVLARLCQVLECQIGDLFQWVPNGDELATKPKPRGIAANQNRELVRRRGRPRISAASAPRDRS